MARATVQTTFTANDKVTKELNKITGKVAGLGRTLKYALTGGAIALAFKGIVSEAQKLEDAVAAFTPLMGGAEKANKLVEELNKTAAATPFQFQDISDAAKQLLPVMNQDIEKTVETFRMLGDTAGGNAQKLDSVTRGFTKAMLKGKVDLESLNMIAEAGVPIFDQLAKSLGVTTADMFKMVSAGKVTTESLTKSFKTMTSEGGIFYKGMEIASKTLSGKLSTLKDNFALTAAAIGTTLMPTIKPLIDRLIELSGAVQKWIGENQQLINQRIEQTIGAIKTVVDLLVGAWNSGLIPAVLAGVVAFKAITMGIAAYKGALVLANAVQLAFNLAMSANPIGLIIIAISTLVGLIVLLIANLEKVKAFFDSIGKGIGNFGNAMRSLGVGGADDYDPLNDPTGLTSRNQGIIESRSVTESRQTVDVNLGGLPQGTTIKERGTAPGVKLNYGFSGLRGAN